MKVVIDEFRPLARNTLRGFARVRLPEGIVLHDVTVHVRDGKAWASPPGKPMVGRDGAAMKDAAGKVQYSPLMTFLTRADQDAFSNGIIAVLRAAHPEVLT